MAFVYLKYHSEFFLQAIGVELKHKITVKEASKCMLDRTGYETT